jgi:nicotinate phosphoribosyltransferase
MTERIIYSLLDTDLYKLTMMQAVFHQFPNTQVKYKFYCRNSEEANAKNNFHWDDNGNTKDLQEEIFKFCELRFTEKELDYLSTLPFMKKDFIDFLRLYKPNPDHIKIWNEKGNIEIEIDGPWVLTILFEVPVLAIVNEVYFSSQYPESMDGAVKLLNEKHEFAKLAAFKYADFGTRRRFSLPWHREVVQFLMHNPNFVGTSNVMMAMDYGLKPIGTMAHEWIMAGVGMPIQLADSQAYMLQKWADEYRGDLGIALTDTYGADAFCKDFDLYFAKLYDGLRHDSGDPIEWAIKMVLHYRKLGVDPKTKTLVFSDGLTMEKANEIYDEVGHRAHVSFGIGTYLTNDIPGLKPLNIVIKMTECNGRPTAKLSDEPGKEMCEDKEFLSYLKSEIGRKNGQSTQKVF